MRYTYNGNAVQATTTAELVARLHEQSESPSKTDALWMKEVSARMKVQFGKTLDTSSPELFIEGLVDLGLLKQEG